MHCVSTCRYDLQIFIGDHVDESRKFIGFDLGAESGRCIVGVLADGRLELNAAAANGEYRAHSLSGFGSRDRGVPIDAHELVR